MPAADIALHIVVILWQGLCDVNGKSAIGYEHRVILPLTTFGDSYSEILIMTKDSIVYSAQWVEG